MKVIICDLCDKIIKDGDNHSNTIIVQKLDGTTTELELIIGDYHICESCFNYDFTPIKKEVKK